MCYPDSPTAGEWLATPLPTPRPSAVQRLDAEDGPSRHSEQRAERMKETENLPKAAALGEAIDAAL
jgi:hypothetical protein